MDQVKASQLEQELKDKKIGGSTVASLVNFGKSAAVFRATKGEDNVALKIFDDELIAKYGDESQLQRIERELKLVGKYHPNMVKILDGGFDTITKNHFILMEYLDAPNLKESLLDIPPENIGMLIEQLSSCGKFLEDLGLVHRDIKPENIIVLDDYSRLVLLDFGVLRPVGEPGLTDDDGVQAFVGTLQYSSPEFLLREELDTTEGWRALTFYQIGGVLHDLIMREELFVDRTQPYARLVNAVQHDTPGVHNPSVPSYLVEAARAALSKGPEVRLSLLNWSSFEAPKADANQATAAKERVTNRVALLQAPHPETEYQEVNSDDLIDSVVNYLKVRVRGIRNGNTSSLPPVTVTRNGSALTVCFGPSENHGLSRRLAIEIAVDILDANISAVQLSASAFIGDCPPDKKASPIAFHRGVFMNGNASAALEKCIYICVDRAQQATSESEVNFLALDEIEVKDD